MMTARPPLLGIRHVALYVPDLELAEKFWTQTMGYLIEWRPDADNLYLTVGTDNLALHRRANVGSDGGRLDHIGLAVQNPDDVDAWAVRLQEAGVTPTAAPRTHRDGSRSLYFHAPDGSALGPLVQIIYHRPLSQ